MTFNNIVLIGATTCTALMAGLLFSYSFSVMPGLKTLPNPEFIGAMQSFNKAIQNPVFFIVFFGSLFFIPLSAYLNYTSSPSQIFWLLLAAAIVYVLGVFGTTVLGNIPLNNSLEKFQLLHKSADEISHQRMLFETRWNNLNYVRTLTSIISLMLLIIACLNFSKK